MEILEERQDKILSELGGAEGIKEIVNSLSDKEKSALQTKIKELEAKVNEDLQDLKTGFSLPINPDFTYEIMREELGSVLATITLPIIHGVTAGGGLVIGGLSSMSWLKNKIALRKAKKEQKKCLN